MNRIFILVLVFAAAIAAGAMPPRVIDPNLIQDKVSITLGQQVQLGFKQEGNRLLQPTKLNGTNDAKASVKVQLDVTSASPIAPPRKGAVRPFLHVDNGFDRPLRYRALARLKGSAEFREIGEGVEPVPAAGGGDKCWDFDTPVEEVVLYQFTLSEKSAE